MRAFIPVLLAPIFFAARVDANDCDDKCVLQALYVATNGDDWDYNENWNFVDPDSNPCDTDAPWHGIECLNGQVRNIGLRESAVSLLSSILMNH